MSDTNRLSVEDAAARISAANGNVVAMMHAVGLDPKVDFCGGDWRKCNFEGLDLRGFDFSNTRLLGASFAKAQVAGADFSGADSIARAGLHLANDWRDATLSDEQFRAVDLVEKIGSIRDEPARVLKHLNDTEVPLHFLDYLSLIRQAPNYTTAYAVLNEMLRRGLVVDAAAYETLMFRCEDATDATALLDEFLATGLPITGRLLVFYCTHLQNLDGFTRVFSLMKAAQDPNPSQFFNMALKHAAGISQLMALIEVLRGEGFKPDSYTLHEIFVREPNFDFRMAMVERWHSEFFKIETFVLNELLFCAHKPEQFTKALSWFKKLNQPYDEFTHSLLIGHASSWDDAKVKFAQMIEVGVQPKLCSVRSLVRRAGKFSEACEALVLGFQAGTAIHDYNLLTLLPEKVSNATLARRLLRDHREAGHSPRVALRGIVNGYRFYSGNSRHNKLLIALGLRPNGEQQD